MQEILFQFEGKKIHFFQIHVSFEQMLNKNQFHQDQKWDFRNKIFCEIITYHFLESHILKEFVFEVANLLKYLNK